MRLLVLFATGLLTVTVACGDDDAILQPDESNTPIATATPYAVQPNVIIVSGTGGTSTTAPAGGTGAGGGSTTSEVRYIVQAGDTLIALAGRYGTTVEAIMTRNNIASASDLRAGQEIVIPSGQSTVATPPAATATPATTSTPRPTGTAAATATPAATGTPAGQQRYTVQSGDLAGAIAARFGVTLEQLAAANNRSVESLDELSIGDVLIIPAR